VSPISRKPWYRRRSTWWAEECPRRYGLTVAELYALGDYNTERHRGLVHTETVQAYMMELQRRYNEALRDG
jgi:hypothetical protein